MSRFGSKQKVKKTNKKVSIWEPDRLEIGPQRHHFRVLNTKNAFACVFERLTVFKDSGRKHLNKLVAKLNVVKNHILQAFKSFYIYKKYSFVETQQVYKTFTDAVMKLGQVKIWQMCVFYFIVLFKGKSIKLHKQTTFGYFGHIYSCSCHKPEMLLFDCVL